MLKLDEGYVRLLHQLLDDYLRQRCQVISSGRHVKMNSLASLYSYGIYPLVVDYTTDSDAVIIASKNLKLLKVGVAAK